MARPCLACGATKRGRPRSATCWLGSSGRFPRSDDTPRISREYNREAAALAPGQNRLIAIDWWNGNRVPYADKGLRGLIAGFDISTSGDRHLSRA